MQKIFTFSLNAVAISGSEARNTSQLKNVCLTSCQPGEFVMTTASDDDEDDRARERDRRRCGDRRLLRATRASAFELRGATSGPARRSPSPATCSGSSPACRSPSASSSAPFTHAASELPFWKTIPKCSPPGGARELAEDQAVRHLDGSDVEGRRQVDDEAVDLLVLQRLDGGVVRVEHRRLLRGLDRRP